jgi:hypothetical protein
LFSDPNIYCAAGLLIWCHSANANTEAARIADTMRGFGDRDGQAFWIKVGQAITELEAQTGRMQSERGSELEIVEKQNWRAAVLPKLVALSFVFALLLPSGALALSPAAPFPNSPTEAQAQQHCPADIVFWLKLPTGIYHAKGQRGYGRTKSGAYVCRYIVRVPRQRPANPAFFGWGVVSDRSILSLRCSPPGPGGRPGSAPMTDDDPSAGSLSARPTKPATISP